jgi:AraC family transcriptional regulator, exoenzyme S synthesis regulatory protein ExsA
MLTLLRKCPGQVKPRIYMRVKIRNKPGAAMLNLYDYIANSNYFKTFTVNDLLWVEYKCMITDDDVAYWTHSNYFAYILSGNTKYKSGNDEYVVRAGDALFVRKGAYVASRNGTGDYCALIIFVPDDFIRKVTEKYPSVLKDKTSGTFADSNAIFPLSMDESLNAYFHSVLSYFPRSVAPCDELLKIKFEELLLNIFTGGQNRSLGACLRSIRDCGKVSLRDVMEASFMYPMGLEAYARLCARSLSAFKSDFYEIYKMSPGKWLIRARLEYARALLETSDDSVGDIAFKSGFKNTAHFVKVFKESYGMPPMKYRIEEASKATSAMIEA